MTATAVKRFGSKPQRGGSAARKGFRQGDGTFAATSGLTDGTNVYGYFGSRGLYCYDFEGKLKWSKDLGKMRIAMGFGEGNSPTIYGNTIIVNWDNEDGSYIVALDKNTGKEIWKNSREERTSWSTPLIVVHGGKAEVVTDATRKIRSYNIVTGKLIWECEGLTRNVIPSPVADSERIYCMSGFHNALLAIKIRCHWRYYRQVIRHRMKPPKRARL